jgi:hypothetical protein
MKSRFSVAAVTTLVAGLGLAAGDRFARIFLGEANAEATAPGVRDTHRPSQPRQEPAPRKVWAPVSPSLAQSRAAIELPPLGSLDQQVLEGNHALRLFRRSVINKISGMIVTRCRSRPQNGDMAFAMMATVNIAAGAASIVKIEDLVVERGAPLHPEMEACIRQLPVPLVLAPPGGPPKPDGTQSFQKVRGWRLPDQTGTIFVRLSVADDCSK